MTEQTRIDNAAQTALEQARRGRRVLIVTRTHIEAAATIERVSQALTAADDAPCIVNRARLGVVSSAWQRGTISAAVGDTYQLRGRSADTVLLGPALKRRAIRELQPILAASPDPLVASW